MRCSSSFIMIFTTTITTALKVSAGPFLRRTRAFPLMQGVKLSTASTTSQKNVLVPVSHGSEEIETITIVDTLVRGGANVTLAAVASSSHQVLLGHGVHVLADKFISDCLHDEWDMIVCPGGSKGTEHLRDCKKLHGLLERQYSSGRWVAGICAAPAMVLSKVVKDKKMTCFNSDQLVNMIKKQHSTESTVMDGNVITSQSPATAMEFSLKLVEVLFGKEKSDSVKKGLTGGK
jgi:4-methyl-5(b-hydroxyethyl)-thiazole monophosphate biosynthesis